MKESPSGPCKKGGALAGLCAPAPGCPPGKITALPGRGKVAGRGGIRGFEMAIFDDIMDKARQMADFAGKKTSEAVGISKLKLQAVQINSTMQSTYERIGELIYEQEKTGTDNYDLVAVCISEIDSLLVELNEINDRIADLKNAVRCPACGAANPENALYCAKCGGRLAHDTPGAKEVVAEDFPIEPLERTGDGPEGSQQ